MQQVSQEWIEAHSQDLLPENYIEITYKVTESGINDEYSVSNTDMAPMGSVELLSDPEGAVKYTTLELNQWILNGTGVALPDSEPYGDNKFISKDVCDSEGYFDENPVIELRWDEVHTSIIPGVLVQWSETYSEYPLQYKVTVYNGDTVMNELVETENDSALNVIFVDIANFDRMTLEIVQWNLPYHRARVEQFYVGIADTYLKGDLMSYSHEDYLDIMSGELPKNSITFSLDNVDNRWNPLNPQGKAKYLAEQQTLHVRYGMKVADEVEWIDGGVFFLSEWNTPSNGIEATFTARDMLGFMNVPYTGTRMGTLYEIADAAISQIDLPDDATYSFDDSLKSISVDFTEDTSDYDVAVILQMVANAGRCIMHQDRKGCLRIEPADMTIDDYVIGRNILYNWPEFTLSKELKSVDVNNGMAVVEYGKTGATQTIDNPLIVNESLAADVAQWAVDTLKGRKTVEIGSFRADTRLSAGDVVTVGNRFSEEGNAIYVTSIKFDFTGAFKGAFEGRVIE